MSENVVHLFWLDAFLHRRYRRIQFLRRLMVHKQLHHSGPIIPKKSGIFYELIIRLHWNIISRMSFLFPVVAEHETV
jgi:hypothetical protein